MYEIIDKNLMIEACSIGDLTLDQIESFLRLWGDGSNIKTLTLFLKNDGTVVLNKDNSRYEFYREIVHKFLEADEQGRKEIRNSSPDSGLETLNTIESVIRLRARNKTMKILKHNLVVPEGISYGFLRKILESYDDSPLGLYKILTLGYIYGERAERARRKR